MSAITKRFVHTVTVEPFAGALADDLAFGPPKVVACWVEEVLRLATTGESDEETSGSGVGTYRSSSTVYAALSAQTLFPLSSRVTLPSGRVATVIQMSVFDSGRLRTGLDHIEVRLT